MKAVLFPTEAAGSQWEMGGGGATVCICVYGSSNLPYHGVGANDSQAPHAWGVVCMSATPTCMGVVCISATPICMGCGLHHCHTHMHNITITLLNVVNTGHKHWKQYIITNHTQLVCSTQV